MSNIIIIRAYNLKVTATNDQSNPVLIGDVVSMSFGDIKKQGMKCNGTE